MRIELLGARPHARAIDRLMLVYLLGTGAYAALLGGGQGLLIAAGHALVAAAVAWLGRVRPRRPATRFLRLTYPVLTTPVLYAELAVLNRYLTDRFFDATVQGWDAALFGGQPSVEWSARLPWLPFSEFLHLGYMAYYAIVPAALLGVYLTRGPDALHRTAFSVALAFFACYAVFIVFPVAGPRYEFPAIGGRLADGTFYGLVHTILESGSSRGTAFPSSHIAASLSAVLAAGREDRRWLWLLIVPEAALALGTVYGRFHYGIDAGAGIVVAVLAVLGTPALIRRWQSRQPGSRPGYPTG